MSNGNKNAQSGVLDTRVQQDQENSTNSGSTYLASPTHNGRRFMVVPIVEPKNPNQTLVDGWGLFLLETNGSNSNFYKSGNGNDPYCAVYVGPYTMGSNDKGGATSGSGAYYVTLVL